MFGGSSIAIPQSSDRPIFLPALTLSVSPIIYSLCRLCFFSSAGLFFSSLFLCLHLPSLALIFPPLALLQTSIIHTRVSLSFGSEGWDEKWREAREGRKEGVERCTVMICPDVCSKRKKCWHVRREAWRDELSAPITEQDHLSSVQQPMLLEKKCLKSEQKTFI